MSQPDHHSHDHADHAPVVTDSGARALEEALRSSFVIVRIAMVVLLGVVLLSGVKTIGPAERGIKFRFGKAVGSGTAQLLGPGLHWAWPEPIEKIEKISVSEIQKLTSTIGNSLLPADELLGRKLNPAPQLNPAVDGYVVMADQNIMHTRVALVYRITDPVAYSFNFINSSNTVLNALNNSLLYAAAGTTADEALTNNLVFKERILAHLGGQIAAQRLGITLETGSTLVSVIPPAILQADFDAVSAAVQESSGKVLAAQGDAQTTVRNAETDANLVINAAESQRNSVVKELESFTQAFTALLPAYQTNPQLIREQKLTEAWKNVLKRADDSFLKLLPPGQDELRLQLSREPLKPKPAANQ